MYEYRARCTYVVDADTLDFDVDLGFNVHVNMRFRVSDLHTPEEGSEFFGEVNDYAKRLLGEVGGMCIVRTFKVKSGEERDKYGRYVAEVKIDGDRDYATEVTRFMDDSGIVDRGR
jgi:micrococcal nuclease